MPEEDFLMQKLEERKQRFAIRTLKKQSNRFDFDSNDYLGLAGNGEFQKSVRQEISKHRLSFGSTGSRLLSANHELFEQTEHVIARFHNTAAALIFNSGYDANVGLLHSIASRGDAIIYDSLVHASLRDGIRLSLAPSFSFLHNDLKSLEYKLAHVKRRSFVVVESVYSMDGDQAPLKSICNLCSKYDAYLIVDEAHATGVIGSKGEGLVQSLGLGPACLARIHTFGKALGVHGAAVVGSEVLKQYLVNYARTFIYTTALAPASVAAIAAAYRSFPKMNAERAHLKKLIAFFQKSRVPFEKSPSLTPIQVLITPGNETATAVAKALQENGFDIKPILSPTVPEGKERLRIVLHAFNSLDEVGQLISLLGELS